MKEVSKESGAKRKKSLPRKSTRSTVKRQKMEEDAEKEDLKGYLDIVPREEREYQSKVNKEIWRLIMESPQAYETTKKYIRSQVQEVEECLKESSSEDKKI
ncbi:hypothetical protein Tco_0820045 [Tanacetum coccineum]|uniref:Uncharacterized protein n=1 Tax=Tanacetum coccineum TaxID=301880 RepID=A0ABQ5ACM7_9ASTR